MSSEPTTRSSADASPDQSPKLSIGFVLANQFTLSAFALFVDTLRLSGDEGDRSRKIDCDWDIISLKGQMIRSSCGVEVAPTARFSDAARFDYIAVVGGLLHRGRPFDADTIAALRRLAGRVPLIGICTGTFALAEAGLLAGHSACVSWYHLDEFRERFPDVPASAERLFRIDRNRITCAGGAGAADLAADLVRRHVGPSAVTKALQVLQIERAREAKEPQPRVPLGCRVSDARVKRALLIMEQSVAAPLTVGAIAEEAGVSRRHLERLIWETTGRTPKQLYLDIRLEVAKSAIERSDLPLSRIALEAGFGSLTHFSRRFRLRYGTTASAVRSAARA
jgi:transcriptional regulator GlxA family with amidase domain